jgi:hypothetical protein
LDLRTAAYVLAITRLNDYYITRGIDIWWLIDFIDLIDGNLIIFWFDRLWVWGYFSTQKEWIAVFEFQRFT